MAITLLLCFARLSIFILVSSQLIPLHQETRARTFCTLFVALTYLLFSNIVGVVFLPREEKKSFSYFITIIVKTARNSFADCKIHSV